ncbi:MAG: OmpA family protein [Bacteroidota bacterium]
MKYTILSLLLSFFLVTAAQAQKQPLPSNIGAKVLTINYGYPNSIDTLRFTNGIEAFYSKFITPRISFSVPLKIGVNHLPERRNNMNFISIDGQLRFNFAGYDAKVGPYMLFGGGVNIENFDSTNVQIPVGLGVNFRLAPNSFLNVQAEYRYGLTKLLRNNAQIGIGYTYRLGQTKSDSDGDGVPDEIDQCPGEIGTKELAGCPDSDGDGITDIADACPNLPGEEALLGCPDSDGDGIADNTDKCPDLPGTNLTGGCPDTDGDGVIDSEDECPNIVGRANGCPDSDGDGIPDKDDACPNQLGTAETNGCPGADADGDGVQDNEDECPNEKGSIRTKGCPDEDGDGFADKNDNCPNLAGNLNGCPDTDGDGIDDSLDSCPNRVGTAANNGCPEIVRREEVEIAKEDRDILIRAAKSIRFETASAVLKSESYDILKEVASVLNRYPDLTATIEGHTDDVGRSSTNLELSEERAKSCYEYLIAQGIDSERISYIGYGEKRPIESNRTEEGRKMNRRVEFKLYE